MSNLCVKGALLEPARFVVGTDGSAFIVALIYQPGGVPVVVKRHYGMGSSAQYVAAAAAKRLQKGLRVEAHGDALKVQRYAGQDAIWLLGADHISCHTAAPHIETEPAPLAA